MCSRLSFIPNSIVSFFIKLKLCKDGDYSLFDFVYMILFIKTFKKNSDNYYPTFLTLNEIEHIAIKNFLIRNRQLIILNNKSYDKYEHFNYIAKIELYLHKEILKEDFNHVIINDDIHVLLVSTFQANQKLKDKIYIGEVILNSGYLYPSEKTRGLKNINIFSAGKKLHRLINEENKKNGDIEVY